MNQPVALSNPQYEQAEAATDAVLLQRARTGDQAAFGQLVARYETLVAATVTGMLGSGPDAEDVGQETFIRFYKALDQFRGEARLSTYLTRIAINLSLNAIKRRQRWYRRFLSRDEDPDRFPEPWVEGGREIAALEHAALVRGALQQLEPNFRAVVVLRLINGYSTKETAALLGIPVGTVLSRLARAQRKLHERLGPYLREDGTPRS